MTIPNLKKIYIIPFLLLTLLLTSSVAFSQESQASCSAFTQNQILEEKVKFYQQLDKFLASSQPNSETHQLIFSEYRDLISKINSIINPKATNIIEGGEVTDSTNTQACRNFLSEQKQVIQKTVKLAIQRSNSLKQSYTLIEKYGQINKQFTDLKKETDQVSQKIQTFSQKLPCYADACVQD